MLSGTTNALVTVVISYTTTGNQNNTELANIIQSATGPLPAIVKNIWLAKLFNASIDNAISQMAYRYKGTTITPPCATNVTYFIMRRARYV